MLFSGLPQESLLPQNCELEAGALRRELYYRLNVVPIHLPPSRRRSNDISSAYQENITKAARGRRAKERWTFGEFVRKREIDPQKFRIAELSAPGNSPARVG